MAGLFAGLLTALMTLAWGCGGAPKPMPQDGLSQSKAMSQFNLRDITREATAKVQGVQDVHETQGAPGSEVVQTAGPKDPAPDVPQLIYLDVYQLDVPLGTISGNEAFWKRINEQCVDVATHEMLDKNGVRVGQAPIDEWDYFKKIIDQNPARTQPRSVTAAGSAAVELAVKDLPGQTIAYWDAANEQEVRTYDQSTNLLCLTFMPTPRQAELGSVRVALCPMVRATRKHFVVTPRNQEQEIEYTAAERMYKVNLCTDVPKGTFLIVAPTAAAKWEMSLGHAFFVRDGAAEQFEQILLVVPKSYRVEVTKTAMGK